MADSTSLSEFSETIGSAAAKQMVAIRMRAKVFIDHLRLAAFRGRRAWLQPPSVSALLPGFLPRMRGVPDVPAGVCARPLRELFWSSARLRRGPERPLSRQRRLTAA